MKFQNYLKKLNRLSDKKNALYDKASYKLNSGNSAGAQKLYTKIDKIDAKIDALMIKNQDVASQEELTLKFNS